MWESLAALVCTPNSVESRRLLRFRLDDKPETVARQSSSLLALALLEIEQIGRTPTLFNLGPFAEPCVVLQDLRLSQLAPRSLFLRPQTDPPLRITA